jgi:hypothetical protein
VISIGTSTRNGHFRHIALAIVSGETGENVKASLDAVARAVETYFPDVEAHSEWYMGDDGRAMVEGITTHLQSIGSEEDKASCSVHLFKDTLPKHKGKLADKSHYDRVVMHLQRLQLLPQPCFSTAWAAVKAYWVRKGETKFMDFIQDHHIDQNGGWFDHLWATGLPTSNNTQESNNRHSCRKSLQQCLRK